MATGRKTTKSALALAETALDVAERAIKPYSCSKSRHDFTQPQLVAVLVVRKFLRTDYRGMQQRLAEWSDLRECLRLTKVPHFTTLQKAEQRLLKKGASNGSWIKFSTALGAAAGSAGLTAVPWTLPDSSRATSAGTS